MNYTTIVKTILITMCWLVIFFPVAKPAPSSEYSEELDSEIRSHHHQLEIPKDTYILLRSLRHILGPNGRSPVCSICQSHFVDAETYDYFCLPESDGVDGDICDRLTVLGTTASRNIKFGCKMILLKRPFLCSHQSHH